jgi:hypothetical protein
LAPTFLELMQQLEGKKNHKFSGLVLGAVESELVPRWRKGLVSVEPDAQLLAMLALVGWHKVHRKSSVFLILRRTFSAGR